MYHISSLNLGLGSYNDDFNCLLKDLLMKDHFVEGFYTLGKICLQCQKSTIDGKAWLPFPKYGILSLHELNNRASE